MEKKDKKAVTVPGGRSGFRVHPLELTPEREKEIVDEFAERVVQYGLEAPAILFLTPFRGVSPVASQVSFLPFAPFLEALGLTGFDYVAFFSKPENVEQLINKIKEAAVQKDII